MKIFLPYQVPIEFRDASGLLFIFYATRGRSGVALEVFTSGRWFNNDKFAKKEKQRAKKQTR